MSVPKNWPESVTYLKENIIDKSVSPPTLKLKCKDARSLTCPRLQGPCKYVAIKKIDVHGHPAKGQNGLFALKELQPRSYILDYKGLVSANYSITSDYVLSFDGNLSIDAEKFGNEARHINDFRGVCKRPNAEFDNYLDKDGTLHVGVFVLHERIQKGQEILVSYGKGFWQARGLLPSYDASYSPGDPDEHAIVDVPPDGAAAAHCDGTPSAEIGGLSLAGRPDPPPP